MAWAFEVDEARDSPPRATKPGATPLSGWHELLLAAAALQKPAEADCEADSLVAAAAGIVQPSQPSSAVRGKRPRPTANDAAAWLAQQAADGGIVSHSALLQAVLQAGSSAPPDAVRSLASASCASTDTSSADTSDPSQAAGGPAGVASHGSAAFVAALLCSCPAGSRGPLVAGLLSSLEACPSLASTAAAVVASSAASVVEEVAQTASSVNSLLLVHWCSFKLAHIEEAACVHGHAVVAACAAAASSRAVTHAEPSHSTVSRVAALVRAADARDAAAGAAAGEEQTRHLPGTCLPPGRGPAVLEALGRDAPRVVGALLPPFIAPGAPSSSSSSSSSRVTDGFSVNEAVAESVVGSLLAVSLEAAAQVLWAHPGEGLPAGDTVSDAACATLAPLVGAALRLWRMECDVPLKPWVHPRRLARAAHAAATLAAAHAASTPPVCPLSAVSDLRLLAALPTAQRRSSRD